MIVKKKIQIEKIDILSKLVKDYSNYDSKFKPFINNFPKDYSDFSKTRTLSKDVRNDLVSVIRKQYKDTFFYKSNLNKVNKNISNLLLSNSQTVTTGHQLNVLASPLFLIYKVINTIVLANKLSLKKNKNIIPIFWMASEDHDFKEIQKCNIFKKSYIWKENYKDIPVGCVSNKGIGDLLTEISLDVPDLPYKKELMDAFNNIYSKNKNYANAHRALLTFLFSKYGLVILDANNSVLKKHFIANFKSETSNQNVRQSIKETNDKLSVFYKPHLNPMKDNVFYFKGLLRQKILIKNNSFILSDGSKKWSKKELFIEIEKNPERFSPNVILRALYQEKILPNIAYIGGPSEISYWIQLKKTFEMESIYFPVLLIRNLVLNLSEKEINVLKKYRIKDSDLFLAKDFVLNRYLKKNASINFDSEFQKLESISESIINKAKQVNSNLNLHVEIVLKKVIKDILKLERKLINNQKDNHVIALRKINNLFQDLYFNGDIQERSASYIPYYMKFGSLFFDILIKNLDPLEKDYIILKGF